MFPCVSGKLVEEAGSRFLQMFETTYNIMRKYRRTTNNFIFLEKLTVIQLVNKFPIFLSFEVHKQFYKYLPLDSILSQLN
jgi:hypothetical protein